jgi:hypothetical protein
MALDRFEFSNFPQLWRTDVPRGYGFAAKAFLPIATHTRRPKSKDCSIAAALKIHE